MGYSPLRAALIEAGIGESNPRGLPFSFRATRGSHTYECGGSIRSFGWSDEGGLELYVDLPEIAGTPLISFVFGSEGCHARFHVDKSKMIKRLESAKEGEEERIITEYQGESFLQGTFEIVRR